MPESVRVRVPLLLLVGAVALAAAPARADIVPFDVQVPLVLKTLSYDRTLKTRVTDTVRIAIVAPPGRKDTVQDLNASVANLPRTLDGVPVAFRDLGASEGDAVDRALRNGHWAAAYVMPGFSPQELAQIRRACEAAHVLLVGADAGDVERGTALAIGAREGKPVIMVSLSVTRACGSEFDLALLRLARVMP